MRGALIFHMLLVIVLFEITGCKKLVEVNAPTTSVNEANVFSSDGSATAALTGIYVNLSKEGPLAGSQSISFYLGLSGDELSLWPGVSDNVLTSVYENKQTAISSPGVFIWRPLYQHIFQCNSVLEGLSKPNAVSQKVKTQLTGEAKFLRGLFYFYLVNIFGDVPLVLSTDPKINATLPRSSQTLVYQQIISDLLDAKQMLSENFLNGTLQEYSSSLERVRPTKWAATSLLSRTYLYSGDWAGAESEASEVINSTQFQLVPVDAVFKKNSGESIWQLQPVNAGWNTEDARVFYLSSLGPDLQRPVFLSSALIDSFMVSDLRRVEWVDSVTVGNEVYYFPTKYESATLDADVTEYLTVLRLSEQYLIRSEARLHQNNISEGRSDLNEVRSRAGLPRTGSNDKSTLLEEILSERKWEFFTEFGHRWFDLKRTGKIDAVMKSVTPRKSNGGGWETYQQYFPLPLYDIQKNPFLTQNTGYY